MNCYEDCEDVNDKAVDALARAFVALREAYDELENSDIYEHEKASGFMMDVQGFIVEALSLCRKVEKKIDEERANRIKGESK